MATEISSPSLRNEAFYVSSWIHRLGGLIANHPKLSIRLGNLESSYLSDQLAPIRIDRPIYITGLARAGTTILLDIVASCDGIATHRYRDFPPIFTPFAWNWWLEHIPLKESPPTERAHSDGIFVTPESPEAMEEMLWMAFFPQLHNPAQSNVLDASVANQAFETFYRDHLKKLILTRHGRRYASKDNYHITRLEYLHKLFPDVRFVIPIRHPAAHIASLIKEHRLFIEAHRRHPRALTHFQRVGHFEFGADLRPINVGDTARVCEIQALWNSGDEVRGWARYWAMIYGFAIDRLDANPALRGASLVMRFEELCANPQSALTRLCEHCGLDGADAIARHAERLHTPTYYQAKFSAGELASIDEETRSVRQRFGYE
ncbi:MAG TPA: sulfotransferase [Candidatus Binataceae bacterium]|nr:sulfotransferase [Candidatus Binataceae bacterium]